MLFRTMIAVLTYRQKLVMRLEDTLIWIRTIGLFFLTVFRQNILDFVKLAFIFVIDGLSLPKKRNKIKECKRHVLVTTHQRIQGTSHNNCFIHFQTIAVQTLVLDSPSQHCLSYHFLIRYKSSSLCNSRYKCYSKVIVSSRNDMDINRYNVIWCTFDYINLV